MRAIRILQANWLNEAVAGDRGTVKLVADDMARDAVEVHKIAEYAPEYESYEIPVRRKENAPEPDEVIDQLLAQAPPESVVVEYPGQGPVEQIEADLAEMKLPDETAELKQPWNIASKAEWIRWAAHGDHGQPPVTEEEAAAMTKIQLMSRYGGRL